MMLTPQTDLAVAHALLALRAERDRLRNIVQNAVETLNQVYKHADMTDALREVVAETQREARAAIGEATPEELAALPFNPVYAEVEVRPARGGGGNQRREGAGA